MASYRNNELCINNDCRLLPKNGPISFLPWLRFDSTTIVHFIVKICCLILLILLLSPLIVRLNKSTIKSYSNTEKIVSASQLLDSLH